MDGLMPSSPVETLNTLVALRVGRTQLHNLTDILVLSVLAVICGADSFVATALFGQLNEAWLHLPGAAVGDPLARWGGTSQDWMRPGLRGELSGLGVGRL